MQGWAGAARERVGYDGAFVYAYATKANFAEEVVRTALNAGAHYETSAAADVTIAQFLWRRGVLPGDRFIFCNGSKEDSYIDAIIALRQAGYANIVPILDDLEELNAYLARCDAPLLLGVRERHVLRDVDAAHSGGERFGLTPEEIAQVVERLADTPHQLVVYHAMVGSQLEDIDDWMAHLARSAEAYCRLRRHVSTLRAFNFGGGMPTSAYTLDFDFDYPRFLERLMQEMSVSCAAYDVPQPDLIGEFGRYTVASHNVFLFEIGAVKAGQGDAPDWYLVNGSMMVALPDIMIVEDQQFLTLPLEGWDQPVREVRLAGRRTCDSDDVFPRPSQPPLVLPDVSRADVATNARPYIVAIFGVGAYQQMISGRGGAHHCLSPEMRRIIIERDGDAMVVREVAPQQVSAMMRLLGYEAADARERSGDECLLTLDTPQTTSRPNSPRRAPVPVRRRAAGAIRGRWQQQREARMSQA
jgi:arginine decarboxylase